MAGSGFGFGLCCVGSSAGLMAMLVVLGVMSVGSMAAIAVLVTAQKLLPPRAALEVPLALAIGRIRGCDHRGPLVGAPG
jgi:predicted metal-binding membrane protein